MGRMKEGLTIGELSGACGVSRDTLRFYERKGLLPQPRRTPARYRLYTQEDQHRVSFIRQAQSIGLTLEDIHELLRHKQLRSPDECRRVSELLRERIAGVDRKLGELSAFRRLLAESLERCEKAAGDACPVVLDLSRGQTRRRGKSE